jgi:hypothetical protein
MMFFVSVMMMANVFVEVLFSSFVVNIFDEVFEPNSFLWHNQHLNLIDDDSPSYAMNEL